MRKIEILPPELINQIAAGEVVERPASVVKELVENAIDAGATRIDIMVRDGGRSVRVADNGCGMEQPDLEVAFRNHATSKVKELEDLFRIRTLGFRGEALASIAAISKVTCTSRTKTSESGLKAAVQPSGSVSLQAAGSAIGTIFEVEDLFYNVPARLKFLKRHQTELSHIHETVQTLALSHPEVSFQLTLEDSVALKSSGSGELSTAINEIFSLKESEKLIHFNLEDKDAGYRLWGETSSPDLTRGSRKWITIFVNGRGVKCHILGKAIEGAYTSLMAPGKFPITVLFLEVPHEEVDVNVHPTKREVKYQKPNTLFSFVRRALDMALVNPLPQAFSPTEGKGVHSERRSISYKPTSHPSYDSLPKRSYENPVIKPYFPRREREESSLYQAAMDIYKPTTEKTARIIEDSSSETLLPQLTEFEIIGQLSKTYILLEYNEGLMILDQHIASERVLFELFSEQSEKSEPVSQSLLIPLSFPLSPTLSDLLDENRGILESLGFLYNLSAADVCFSQVPSLYTEKVLQSTLEEFLFHLEETSEARLSLDGVIATAACHAAVRAGDYLNQEQMQQVVSQWFRCSRPWTCPHGRSVSHTITREELLRFFDRPGLPSYR